MNFESLATEILFDVFDYLNDIDIFQIFYNLNYHFNQLLLTYFRISPQLNLQSIPKTYFDIACKYFIPLIINNIQSLHLSNDNDTPQQINRFLSYGLTLYKFINLKSLSLDFMHSEKIINRMMIEWKYPNNLTHLKITNCQVLNDWNIVDSMINNIWSLPKLTHCHLDIEVIDGNYSFVPNVISSSIKYLSVKGLSCNIIELNHLFQYTPYLQYLNITINDETNIDQHLSFSIPLLTTLKVCYQGSFDVLRNLLEITPNLRHLTIRMKEICVEGHQWAEIITNHLSKLKVFHLLMQLSDLTWGPSLDQLVSTYRTPFWIEEHKWYILLHYYCNSRLNRYTMFLYTLPYIFGDYNIDFNYSYARSESYFLNYDDQISYDHVHHLFCKSLRTIKYRFRNRFSHIYHLTLNLPCDDNLWTFVPTFDQLRVLEIFLSYTEAYNTNASFQLQTLLKQAPKLHSLVFRSSISSLLPLLESTSESIIKLDLQNCDNYFNYSNCATLFLSSLGKQCQILSIKVRDKMNILQLVKEMPQLRTLNVECSSDTDEDDVSVSDNDEVDVSVSDNDELIDWLKSWLPSTCIITRDSCYLNTIHIWIR